VLLLQVRDHPGAERQEQACFVERAGLPATSFRFRNLLREPELRLADADDADVVVIGGAGKHSVTRRYPFTAPLEAFVAAWVAAGRPLFGSCFGHQFVASALGGVTITDPERQELGTGDLELTAAGVRDPLFAGLAPRFPVQLGHHDRVAALPPGAVDLARTAVCPHQAFRLEGLPVWGCQFHVEMDERSVLERAAIYRDEYLPGAGADEQLARRLRPSPEASTLFARFLDLAADAA
jgi:GMP synthase (glutamine-hydrolysing)